MTMTTVPLNEVKARLSEMVGRAHDSHERITITVHGEPRAVLVSAYEFESLLETLDILGDPETMRALAEAKTEPTYSLAEVADAIAARRGHGNAA